MKLSEWLRGPVPHDDPFGIWCTRIALLLLAALALWPFTVTAWLYLSGAPIK